MLCCSRSDFIKTAIVNKKNKKTFILITHICVAAPHSLELLEHNRDAHLPGMLHRLTRGTSVISRLLRDLFTLSCLLWFRDKHLGGNQSVCREVLTERSGQLSHSEEDLAAGWELLHRSQRKITCSKGVKYQREAGSWSCTISS